MVLDLSWNQIVDIGLLNNLDDLLFLNLSHNKIKDIILVEKTFGALSNSFEILGKNKYEEENTGFDF